MRIRSIAAVSMLFCSLLAARADVIYTVTFSQNSPIFGVADGTYSFSQLDYLSALTTVNAIGFTSQTGKLASSITLNPADPNCGGFYAPPRKSCVQVDFVDTSSIYGGFLTTFPAGNGVLSVGDLSLTISGSPGAPVSVTPEPSSVVLLGSGILAVVAGTRRHLRMTLPRG